MISISGLLWGICRVIFSAMIRPVCATICRSASSRAWPRLPPLGAVLARRSMEGVESSLRLDDSMAGECRLWVQTV